MRILLAVTALAGWGFCAGAQTLTNPAPARLKFKVICFAGNTNSGASSTSACCAPDSLLPGNGGEHTVTNPGKASDLKWSFVGRNGTKDVYRFRFTRQVAPDAVYPITALKEVQFDGKRVIVFEDALHCVLMETADEVDCKQANDDVKKPKVAPN